MPLGKDASRQRRVFHAFLSRLSFRLLPPFAMAIGVGLERSLRSGAAPAAAAEVGGAGRAETNEAAVGVEGEAREHGHVEGGEHGR